MNKKHTLENNVEIIKNIIVGWAIGLGLGFIIHFIYLLVK